MQLYKKVMALPLTAVFAAPTLSGCSKQVSGNGSPASEAANSDASATASLDTSQEVTLSLVFGEHPTELYHPDTLVIKNWAKEIYIVNLDITSIPS